MATAAPVVSDFRKSVVVMSPSPCLAICSRPWCANETYTAPTSYSAFYTVKAKTIGRIYAPVSHWAMLRGREPTVIVDVHTRRSGQKLLPSESEKMATRYFYCKYYNCSNLATLCKHRSGRISATIPRAIAA